MVYKIILSLVLCLALSGLSAQSVGINNNTPHPSSILDIDAKYKGVLIPRISTVNRLNIISPAEGLMVYDTDEKGFYFYQSGWKKVGTTEAIADLDGDTEITVEDTPDSDVVKIKANGMTILTLSRKGQDDYLIEAGSINTFFGRHAGANNEALQSGEGTNNTFLGVNAGLQNSEGSDNTFVGHDAGRENDTGQNNTYIGKGAGLANVSGSNNVYIGHGAGSSLISGDNQLILANNDIITPLVYGEFDNAILRVNGELQVGYEYAFPLTDGSSSQVMRTDGIGNIYWSADQVDDADADPMNELQSLTYSANQLSISNGNSIPLKESPWETNGIDVYYSNGNVGIGSSSTKTGYKLSVDGKMVCEEVLVELSGDWPDYVFKDGYDLLEIDEVETFIQREGHLPGILAASEIENNGIQLGEMQRKIMEKIEELTLYIIDLNKENQVLTEEIEKLKNK